MTLDGSGSSDPDGTVVRYLWTQPTGPLASLPDQVQVSTSFTVPELNVATTLVFRHTATDDDGATASDDVSVTVTARPGIDVVQYLTGPVEQGASPGLTFLLSTTTRTPADSPQGACNRVSLQR